MPRRGVAGALTALGMMAALAGCHPSGESASEAQATNVPRSLASGTGAAAVEEQDATPVKDRVATLGLLNKRNDEEQDLIMKSGESRRIGNIVVKLATCEKTAPWERPPETGAFVQVFVQERASISESLAWHKIFSGWLFKNSPSLNVVQHPVYDVWVKDCAMNFPGQEENPADFAKVSKAAKASGSASGAASSTAPPPAAPVAGDTGAAAAASGT